MWLPESCEFDVPALIRKFGVNDAPSQLNEPQTCASVFATPSVSPEPPRPRSLRESYQVTPTWPVVGSSATFGMNWLLRVVSSLTRVGPLHVAPLSSE